MLVAGTPDPVMHRTSLLAAAALAATLVLSTAPVAQATTPPQPPAAPSTEPTTTPPPPPPTTPAPPPDTTTAPTAATTLPPTTTTTEAPVATTAPSTEPTSETSVPDAETSVPSEDTLPEGIDETGEEYSSPIRLADGHVTRPIIFPVVGGYWLGSGWNDTRDDGARYHHGVDVIAGAGQPVVSPVDGRITEIYRDHPTIDHGVMVTDDRGFSFRLFHMSPDMADDLAVGERVVAGQLLGFVGDDQGIRHIHVELLRPSGVQINPHWSLAGARFDGYPCADPATVTPDWSAHPGMIVSPDDRQYVLNEPARCRPLPPPPAPTAPTPRWGGPGVPSCRPV